MTRPTKWRRPRSRPGDYRGPWWLPGADAQTIYPYFLPRPPPRYRRERIETPDEDFWDFDWVERDARADAPMIVLFHGLEGSSDSHYAGALTAAGGRSGLARSRAALPQLRRHAEPAAARVYHSGDHEEIGECWRQCAPG